MESKTFYDRIIEDEAAFDKVLYDLEKMIAEAPNPRIRTQAELSKTYLIQVREIAFALKNMNK